jgi:hypothetical protein
MNENLKVFLIAFGAIALAFGFMYLITLGG